MKISFAGNNYLISTFQEDLGIFFAMARGVLRAMFSRNYTDTTYTDALNKLAEIETQIDIVDSPTDWMAQIQTAIYEVARSTTAYNLPTFLEIARFGISASVYQETPLRALPRTTTPSREQEAFNRDALLLIVSTATIGYACDSASAAGSEYDSQDQLYTVRSAILARADETTTWLATLETPTDQVIVDLNDTVASCVAAMAEKQFDTPPTIGYTVQSQTNSLLLAFEIFSDIEMENPILDMNPDITDPGNIRAETTIQLVQP